MDSSSTDPYSAVCFVTAVRGEEREPNCAACPEPTRNIDWRVNTSMHASVHTHTHMHTHINRHKNADLHKQAKSESVDRHNGYCWTERLPGHVGKS